MSERNDPLTEEYYEKRIAEGSAYLDLLNKQRVFVLEALSRAKRGLIRIDSEISTLESYVAEAQIGLDQLRQPIIDTLKQ